VSEINNELQTKTDKYNTVMQHAERIKQDGLERYKILKNSETEIESSMLANDGMVLQGMAQKDIDEMVKTGQI
jgi:hypothetical protein